MLKVNSLRYTLKINLMLCHGSDQNKISEQQG